MNFVLTAIGEHPRRRFDPSKQADAKELAFFRKNQKWEKGCPFYLEWPYSDIASMCMAKFTDHALKV
jgi:hypothetical protein